MKKLILILLTLILILGCTEIDRTEKLTTKVDSLKVENDSLTKLLEKKQTVKNPWYNAEYDGKPLIDSGITNPEEFIKNSLREKPDLIPFEAVLGGTMYFMNIQLLGRKWLIADFEDGHIQGKAIYGYKLDEKGKLKFKLLNSIGPE